MYKVLIKLNRNHHVFPILKHYFKFIVKFLIKVPTELKFLKKIVILSHKATRNFSLCNHLTLVSYQ